MGRPPSQSELATVKRFTPLVSRIAGGFVRRLPSNILHDDLFAAGMGGLWEAIRRNPECLSEQFEWYARVRIRGAILDDLRSQDWLPRRHRVDAAALAHDVDVPPVAIIHFDEVGESELDRALSDISSSEAAVASKITQETLAEFVATLPERERYIVIRHYHEGARFKDIGAELGVTEPRISQLHARAMDRLRGGKLRAALRG
jgi:RNA polymerase sigma factor for flagellar operon FliA